MAISILTISLLLLASSSYITSAFFIYDTYRLRGEITTGGHVNLTTVGPKQNVSKIAVGQPIIGNISGVGYKMCFGVFCTDVFKPQYSMNFSGRLNYSNGSAVIYTLVKIIVKYLSSQIEGTNRTDGLGQFFIKIDNLPEFMMNKDLNITTYVQGEIEAVYDCWYNNTEGCCCKQPGPKSCKSGSNCIS